MITIYFYIVSLVGISTYSYALIDPNLTLVPYPAWEVFRNIMVDLGYYQRTTSWEIYLTLIILLSLLHLIIVQTNKIGAVQLAIMTGLIVLFAYPFLSHDLFNYIFDAKIITFYHANPYLKAGLDFQQDEWLRFMHWTHRTYPYGPSFLIITLVPSLLAMGKFFLNYIFFRLLFVLGYLLSVWIITQKNNRLALAFATHPFIIVEGLINSHNEILAVGLALLALHFSFNKVWAYATGLTSIAIKYMSLPIALLLYFKNKPYLALLAQFIVLGYVCYKLGIQQWYFLNIFIFIINYPRLISRLFIFFFGLLVSYYPYIALGGWDKTNEWATTTKVTIKNNIILIFLAINIVYLVINKKIFTKQK